MFKPLKKKTDDEMVTIHFNDQALQVDATMSVAAALLSHDIRTLRQTLKSQSPRGPFCMMGACFDCLVQIDGATQQACMTMVQEGLKIRSMQQNPENLQDEAEQNASETGGSGQNSTGADT
ncbi:MAG: (2Fe-2S)-binding protein [Cohaesibacter sp.]|nr:(2Fe-2S)-binding protein [Cohaesibacter sp.]